MDITVVIPLYNEEESLPELHAWIKRVMESNQFSYEIIFINDGSTDHSWNVIEDLAGKNSVATTVRVRPSIVDLPKLKVTLSSRWMLIFKTHRMKFQNFIA